ncbi:hypothetical protein BB560_000754 [Smittium megazygosporum]|uniref:Uncharacterized protein n=1 Tax=Smittium megazygosporum TaxID=133381 RepID=A0A2T9ZJG0_9FUNG|nr:hypothetical protein BB560_000754 [Smittium megazygosporum]
MFKLKNPFSRKKSSKEGFVVSSVSKTSNNAPKSRLVSNVRNLHTGFSSEPLSNSTLADSEQQQETFNDASSYHSIDSLENYPNGNIPFNYNERGASVPINSSRLSDGYLSIHNPSTSNYTPKPAAKDSPVFSYQNQVTFSNDISSFGTGYNSNDTMLPPSFNKKRNENLKKQNTQERRKEKQDMALKQKQKGEEYFQLAVKQHELGNYSTAVSLFKKSADLGDPSGFLLFGLCLRHGWVRFFIIVIHSSYT